MTVLEALSIGLIRPLPYLHYRTEASRHLSYRDFSGSLRLPAPSTYICGKSCGGPSLAVRLEVIVLAVLLIIVPLLIIVALSLIAVGLLSMWRVNCEDQLPAKVIWLPVGIIGFTIFLVFLSTFI